MSSLIDKQKLSNLLSYPFDWEYLNRKKKSLKRELEASRDSFIEKKIAILETYFSVKLCTFVGK